MHINIVVLFGRRIITQSEIKPEKYEEKMREQLCNCPVHVQSNLTDYSLTTCSISAPLVALADEDKYC